MANVFLNDKAYARLKAAKSKGESFSDVVIHFVPQKIDWNEFLGSCKGMDVEKAIAQVRRERER